jgi:hypothetical protein
MVALSRRVAVSGDLRLAWAAACEYRGLGLNPLPSTGRRPALREFAALRDHGIDDLLLSKWWTPSVQICLGSRWGVCVLDVDGAAGRGVWRRLADMHAVPDTWAVTRDPAGTDPDSGLHLWFAAPPDPLPFKTVLWSGPPGSHREVALLGDANLIVAPPSIHHRTGGRYRWLPGRSPRDLPLAPLPDWLAASARASRWKPTPLPPRPHLLARSDAREPLRYSLADLDAALGDGKPLVAREWGLKLVDRLPNPAGFIPCHALGREDRHPSASFHAGHGYYSEPGGGCLPFFAVAEATGAYPSWRAAANDVGDRLGVPPRRYSGFRRSPSP